MQQDFFRKILMLKSSGAPFCVWKQIKPKTLENKGFRHYELASQKGLEPPTPRLGVRPSLLIAS